MIKLFQRFSYRIQYQIFVLCCRWTAGVWHSLTPHPLLCPSAWQGSTSLSIRSSGCRCAGTETTMPRSQFPGGLGTVMCSVSKTAWISWLVLSTGGIDQARCWYGRSCHGPMCFRTFLMGQICHTHRSCRSNRVSLLVLNLWGQGQCHLLRSLYS